MKKASITEAKNSLSAMIDGLKNGSPVLIVDRGRPVARSEPVVADYDEGQAGRLLRLIRDGLVRARRARPLRALFSSSRPSLRAVTLDARLAEAARKEGFALVDAQAG